MEHCATHLVPTADHVCGLGRRGAGIDLAALAAATEGYSGSDLEQLCKTAAMRALEEALMVHRDGAGATAGAATSPLPTHSPGSGIPPVAADAADAGATPPLLTEAAAAARCELPAGGAASTATAMAALDAGGNASAVYAHPASTPEVSRVASSSSSRMDSATSTLAAATPAAPAAPTAGLVPADGIGSITLRQLTLDDFLQARAVVRPTRGRFAGVHHHMGHASALPATVTDFDEELYVRCHLPARPPRGQAPTVTALVSPRHRTQLRLAPYLTPTGTVPNSYHQSDLRRSHLSRRRLRAELTCTVVGTASEQSRGLAIGGIDVRPLSYTRSIRR